MVLICMFLFVGCYFKLVLFVFSSYSLTHSLTFIDRRERWRRVMVEMVVRKIRAVLEIVGVYVRGVEAQLAREGDASKGE